MKLNTGKLRKAEASPERIAELRDEVEQGIFLLRVNPSVVAAAMVAKWEAVEAQRPSDGSFAIDACRRGLSRRAGGCEVRVLLSAVLRGKSF